MDFFQYLPNEIVTYIFSYVPLEDINKLRMVNKRYFDLHTNGFTNPQRWNFLSYDQSIFARKQNINIAVIGPKGSGKSTLLGQLLLQTGTISKREAEKTFDASDSDGTSKMKYTFLLNPNKQEKSLKKTIEVRRCRLPGNQHYLTMIDTPGELDLISNMISGISQADYAIIVVPADLNKLQYNIEQIQQLIHMCRILRMKELIIVVNKMDCSVSDTPYTFEKLQVVKRMLDSMTKKFKTIYVPVSAWEGENISRYSSNMSWYSGKPLIKVLEQLALPPRDFQRPLRITIDKAFKISGIGTVILGCVIQGYVRVDDFVKISPSNIVTQIKSMHMAVPKTPIEVAYPGDYISMNLRNVSLQDVSRRRSGLITNFFKGDENSLSPIDKKKEINRWNALSDLEKELEAKQKEREGPMHPVRGFTAKLFLFNPLGSVRKGYKPTLHCHNAQIPIEIEEILEVFDQDENGEKKSLKNPINLKKNQVATVKFKLENRQRLSIDTAVRCQSLGRFFLRESYAIIGAGLIIKTDYSGPPLL